MLENCGSGFKRWLANDTDQIVDTDVCRNRLVESLHAFRGHQSTAGVRIDDQRISSRDHIDGVAGNRWQGVRDRCDRTDDTERCVFNHRQSTITAVGLSCQELSAWNALAERLQFGDLVFESTDLRLIHFHRAEFDRLVDGDSTDVIDGFLAIRDGPRAQLLKGLASGSDGLVGVIKNAPATIEIRS